MPKFRQDFKSENEYFDWIYGEGKDGFLANIRSTRVKFVCIHEAECPYMRMELPKGTHSQSKRRRIWCDDFVALQAWARQNIKPTRGNSAIVRGCSRCGTTGDEE